MSDPNTTLWQPPVTSPTLPPADGIVKQLPGMGELASKVSQSPNYQALQGQPPQLSFMDKIKNIIGNVIGAPKQAPASLGDAITGAAGNIGNAVQAGAKQYKGGLVGLVESLPGAGFVEKSLSPEAAAALAKIKSDAPFAVASGKRGGFVAQMAAPGLNLVKGAGFLGDVGNAAINAAPYALGQGLDVGATTGDAGKGVKAGLLTEGLGTALPAAVSGLSQIPAVSRMLTKMQLAGAGMRTSDAAKNLRQFATHSLGLRGPAVDSYVADHAVPLEEKLGGLIDQFGYGRAGKEAMRKWNDDGFDAHNAIFEAVTGNHLTTDIGKNSDIDHVLSDPDLAENALGVFKPADIQAAAKEIGDKIDGLSWQQIRSNGGGGVLGKFIHAGMNPNLEAESPVKLKALVAQAWHNYIDSMADSAMTYAKQGALGEEAQQAAANVPDLLTLKSTYPAIQSIKKVQAREEPGIPTNFAKGSDTFARAATDAVLGGTLGPAGAVASHFIGPIIAKVAGKGLERGTGMLAGALKNASKLPQAAIGRGAAMLGGTGLPEMLSGPRMPTGPSDTPVGTEPPQNALMYQGSPTVNPIPVPPATGQPQGPGGAQPIPNAPAQPPAPTPADLQNKASEDFLGDTQNASGHAFSPKLLEQRLQMMYELHQRRLQGFAEPYEQFVQSVKAGTDNFNPDNPATWQGLVDNQAQAEKLYKAHMALKKMDGPNVISNALNHYTDNLFNSGIGGSGRLSSSDRMAHDADNEKLISALKGMGVGDTKEIDTRLKQIMWDKGKNPEQKKQAVIEMIVNEGGVDLPKLMQMGLWK